MKDATLVIGTSLNEKRYSNLVVKTLKDKLHLIKAIGIRKGEVDGIKIDVDKKDYKNIDTVTLYLNPKRQEEYYNYIINLKPRRVIFNPGTENMEFINLLEENNIKSEIACTLVLLSTNQY